MRLNEREIHGGTVGAGKVSNPVILCERDNDILIRKEYHSFAISAASARVMARNLQRIARRIEARAASAGEAGTAETTEIGSVHEHATAAGGDAQPESSS